jgi:hypothetical protein
MNAVGRGGCCNNQSDRRPMPNDRERVGVSRFDDDEIMSFERDDIAAEFGGTDVSLGTPAQHPRVLRRVECAGLLPRHHAESPRAGMSGNGEWSLNAHSDKLQAEVFSGESLL